MSVSEIFFHDVTKRFRDKEILSDANFELKNGLTFMVGKNGAGKTTFISLAVGLESVDSGTVELFGKNPQKLDKNTKKKLGLQMQNDSFLRNVKVREYIKLYEALYTSETAKSGKETGKTADVTNKVDAAKVREILELDSLLNRYAYTLSGGEKKKISLYLSILGNRKLIILDEPTAGIDVQVKDKIVYVIKYLRDCGINLLVSSHDLEEFYSIADNILMLDCGIVYDGSKAVFEEKYGYGYRICADKEIADDNILVGRLFENRYLYGRDKETLAKYFPLEEVEKTTAKDLYQIALLSGKTNPTPSGKENR
ncbi:MAG: ABC transporter ATP-binding protein [Varibaculum sp.]|nr:ABC transporter ATP-binding protein [Varibaculum sp.]